MTSAEDLGKAVKNGQDTIEVEGNLAGIVFKLKVIGDGKWAVCIVGIMAATAIAMASISTVGAATAPAALVGAPVLAGTVSILGVGTTIAAITIAIAGGGASVLNMLRDYDMTKISDDKIILRKRNNSCKRK